MSVRGTGTFTGTGCSGSKAKLWSVPILWLLLAACTSGSANTTEAPVTEEALQSAPIDAATSLPEQSTATSEPSEPTEPLIETSPRARCVTITDFASDVANDQWVVVNDGVMGGQSFGERTFDDGTMIFSGSTNTDGGGFVFLRVPLDDGVIDAADQIVFRARADARSYMVTFDNSVAGSVPGISYRAPLEFATPGEWETVIVPFEELGATVGTDSLQKDIVTRVGFMIFDGSDGDFRLEVETIEACASS